MTTMSSTASGQSSAGRPRLVLMAYIVAIYLVFVWSFFETGGLEDLKDWSIPRFVQRLLLILTPVAFGLLWIGRPYILWVDYHVVYAPFVLWAVTNTLILAHKHKGLSNAYLEIMSVGLLLLGYSTRFLVLMIFPRLSNSKVAIVYCGVTLIGSGAIAVLFPVMPD